MAFIGNVIWLITSFYIPILYLICGILFFPLLPFVWPAISFSFLPFGRKIVKTSYLKKFSEDSGSNFDDVSGTIRFLANVVWVFTAGWILALSHLFAAIMNAFLIFTILLIPIAIPNMMAHFRMIPVAFRPFGRKVISIALHEKLEREKANKDFKNL